MSVLVYDDQPTVSIGDAELVPTWSKKRLRRLERRTFKAALRIEGTPAARPNLVPWMLRVRGLAYIKVFYGQSAHLE